jgi:hypothetical protein
MALTVKQYALRLWGVRKSVTQKLGTDITTADITTRAEMLASDVVTAVVLKLLVDAGVFTDAQINAAANAVVNANFPQLAPVVASSMEGAPVPDPDLGA